MRVYIYLSQRSRRIGEKSEQSFKEFSKTKTKNITQFHNSIQK